MNIFKKPMHKHTFVKHSWTYVKCSECGETVSNPELAAKLHADWARNYYKDSPELLDQCRVLFAKRGIDV